MYFVINFCTIIIGIFYNNIKAKNELHRLILHASTVGMLGIVRSTMALFRKYLKIIILLVLLNENLQKY